MAIFNRKAEVFSFATLVYLYFANKKHLESRGILFETFIKHPDCLIASAFSPRIDMSANADDFGLLPLLPRQQAVQKYLDFKEVG